MHSAQRAPMAAIAQLCAGRAKVHDSAMTSRWAFSLGATLKLLSSTQTCPPCKAMSTTAHRGLACTGRSTTLPGTFSAKWTIVTSWPFCKSTILRWMQRRPHGWFSNACGPGLSFPRQAKRLRRVARPSRRRAGVRPHHQAQMRKSVPSQQAPSVFDRVAAPQRELWAPPASTTSPLTSAMSLPVRVTETMPMLP